MQCISRNSHIIPIFSVDFLTFNLTHNIQGYIADTDSPK